MIKLDGSCVLRDARPVCCIHRMFALQEIGGYGIYELRDTLTKLNNLGTLVVEENIEKAKELWEEFVKNNDDVAYSWEKAKRDCCGYTVWKDNGSCDKEVGCYELEYNRWIFGSDHLWD